MKKHRLLFFLLLCFLLFNKADAVGQIDFRVQFMDVENSTGVGFDDPVTGAERRETVNEVFVYLNSVLDHNGAADIVFVESETDGRDFLALNVIFDLPDPGFSSGLAFKHITTGIDPSPELEDARIQFDFGYNFNSGLGLPSRARFDLYSITLHELTHSMGISSRAAEDGTSTFSAGSFSTYDSLLELGNGDRLFSDDAMFSGDQSDLVSNDVFFGGVNATLANGGQRVKLFAPSTFSEGASLSHVDVSLFPDSVVNPSISPGKSTREYSDVDLGILKDLGYTLRSESLLGDVNQDGFVNFSDIAPFISILSVNGYQAEADVNEDGALDFFDISPFIAILGA